MLYELKFVKAMPIIEKLSKELKNYVNIIIKMLKNRYTFFMNV